MHFGRAITQSPERRRRRALVDNYSRRRGLLGTSILVANIRRYFLTGEDVLWWSAGGRRSVFGWAAGFCGLLLNGRFGAGQANSNLDRQGR